MRCQLCGARSFKAQKLAEKQLLRRQSMMRPGYDVMSMRLDCTHHRVLAGPAKRLASSNGM
jgi:hypothetical protein